MPLRHVGSDVAGPVRRGLKFGLPHSDYLDDSTFHQLHDISSKPNSAPRSKAEMVKASCVCGSSAYEFTGEYQAFVSPQPSDFFD